ncbi:MAG: carboxypeptidase, partial [Gemmatimonadales bacterium]|nr:carboxypeptidase [Gemmatimonadales bacterium]
MLKALALIALLQVPAPTQELAPDTRYDPSIPTLAAVAGHDFRAEITPPAQVVEYMEALAASSDRAELIWTGETWEGRPTVMLVLGSVERMARLDEIKADL